MSDNNSADGPIRVFLLDYDEIVRRGVRDLLEAEPDIKVIGRVGTAASALARIPALIPDVAVLHVGSPTATGSTSAARSGPGRLSSPARC